MKEIDLSIRNSKYYVIRTRPT